MEKLTTKKAKLEQNESPTSNVKEFLQSYKRSSDQMIKTVSILHSASKKQSETILSLMEKINELESEVTKLRKNFPNKPPKDLVNIDPIEQIYGYDLIKQLIDNKDLRKELYYWLNTREIVNFEIAFFGNPLDISQKVTPDQCVHCYRDLPTDKRSRNLNLCCICGHRTCGYTDKNALKQNEAKCVKKIFFFSKLKKKIPEIFCIECYNKKKFIIDDKNNRTIDFAKSMFPYSNSAKKN